MGKSHFPSGGRPHPRLRGIPTPTARVPRRNGEEPPPPPAAPSPPSGDPHAYGPAAPSPAFGGSPRLRPGGPIPRLRRVLPHKWGRATWCQQVGAPWLDRPGFDIASGRSRAKQVPTPGSLRSRVSLPWLTSASFRLAYRPRPLPGTLLKVGSLVR